MAVAWWMTLVALVALGAFVIHRHFRVDLVISVAAIYAFLQLSSNMFLVPWYKGGGNGVVLDDWWIWLFQGAVLTGVAWLIATLSRVAKTRR